MPYAAVKGDTQPAKGEFTLQRCRQRTSRHTCVTTNAVHPGVFSSNLQRHITIEGVFLNVLGKTPFNKTLQQAAATSVYVAIAPQVHGDGGGQYYVDCNKAKTNAEAESPALWRKLRIESEKLTGLSKE